MKNALYRAIKYLSYRKGKSLLLTSLFIVLAFISLFSGILESTIENYSSKIENKNGISINVRTNIQRGEEGPNSMRGSTTITQEQSLQIAELDYVSDTLVSANIFIDGSSIEELSPDELEVPTEEQGMRQGGKNISGLKLYASSNINLESDVANGVISLVSGEYATDTNEVVMSSDLAAANELDIGENFTIEIEGSEVEFTITGLYEYTSELNEFMAMMMPENTMYVSYQIVEELELNVRDNYVYYIDDLSSLDHFKISYADIVGEEVDSLTFNVNDSLYSSTIEPLNQIGSGVETAKNIILIITSAIIAVILIITIKERTYEIGVLYSISEKKINIVVQFIIEIIILFTIGFIIALLLNLVADSSVINSLLNNNIFNSINENSQRIQGGPLMSEMSTVTSVGVTINGLNIFMSYLNLLVLCTIAIAIVVMSVLRKSPRDIINE